jgi:cell wall-associated protease
MNGIANNVKIMTVRAVPDGDERDKDVANGIIYAVDNGASIINMSFGKLYSWDKKAVDKALKYARKHDVLLVHAAGNNSDNNDMINHYPVEKYEKKSFFGPERADNWIEVGALSYKQGADFAAVFSNYGQKEVDIFAPGVAIYSTIPDDGYASFQGTSMASPVVAGVAAVVRSYFPDLSAKEVKEVLMSSATPIKENVLVPGTKDKMVPFKILSVSGGVVNLYNALMKAAEMSR